MTRRRSARRRDAPRCGLRPVAALVLVLALAPVACRPAASPSAARDDALAAAAIADTTVAAPAALAVAASDGAGCYLGVVLPSESVEVVAENAGRVERVAVRPGDVVARGAPLAAVAADGLRHELAIARTGSARARAALDVAEIAVRRAEREHRRRLDLGELLSREAVEEAAFELEAATRRHAGAAADLAAVEAELERLDDALARSTARAPFAGTVAARHVDPGTVIAAGAPLVRLIGDGQGRVRFAVPPAEAGRLRPGLALRIDAAAAAAGRAELERVAPEIDAASQTVFAEARLAAAAALPPGSLVRVSPWSAGAACPPPAASR